MQRVAPENSSRAVRNRLLGRGFFHPQPSDPPLASQRRTCSVVIRGSRKDRDHAARTPAACFRAGKHCYQRSTRGVPGVTMSGRVRRAGSSLWHIVKPGTSRRTLFSAFFHHDAFGWRRRQVRARTSSKSWMAVAACVRSMAPAPVRSRRWVSTSLAEAYAMRQWWLRSRPDRP